MHGNQKIHPCIDKRSKTIHFRYLFQWIGSWVRIQHFRNFLSWFLGDIYNRFWTKLELVQSTTSRVGWCYKEFTVLSLVVNFGWWWMSHFRIGGDERLGWWMSGVVNVQFYKGGGERLGWWTSDFTLGVVNVWGGERLRWWTSGVVNVWGGERLILHWGWWMSEVVNVWGGERLRWWTSEVVNVWGGERLILHRGWWTSGVVNVWGGECLGGERLTIYIGKIASKTFFFPSESVFLDFSFWPQGHRSTQNAHCAVVRSRYWKYWRIL